MYSVVVKSPKKREEDRIKNGREIISKYPWEKDDTNLKFGLFLLFTFLLPSFICLEMCKVTVGVCKKVRSISVNH